MNTIYQWLLSFVTTLQPFIVFATGCMTFWLIIRTRPKKFKRAELSKDATIINWTGHPLPEAEWREDYRVWTPSKPPQFNTDSWEGIRASIHSLFKELPSDIQVRLMKGDPNLIIGIPQLGAGLAMLLAVLHGKTGVFPAITCPLRDPQGGFKLPEPIFLGEVRLDARGDRDFD